NWIHITPVRVACSRLQAAFRGRSFCEGVRNSPAVNAARRRQRNPRRGKVAAWLDFENDPVICICLIRVHRRSSAAKLPFSPPGQTPVTNGTDLFSPATN